MAGTTPRWTRVTSARVRCRAGNASFASRMNASTSAAVTRVSSGRTSRADWLVPTTARPCHGVRVSMRPPAVGEASAMSLARFDVTRFIAFSKRKVARDTEAGHDLTGVRPGRIHGQRRAHRRRAPGEPVPHLHAGDARAFTQRIARLDVVHEVRSGAIGGRGEGQRQAVAFDHLIVVPLRAAGQVSRAARRRTGRSSRPSTRAAPAEGAAPARRRRCDAGRARRPA